MSHTNTDNHSKTESKKARGAPVSELSLGKLLSTLTPSQLWGLIGVVFIVLSGAFGVGYKLKSTIAQVDIARLQIDMSSLKADAKELGQKSDQLLVTNKELRQKSDDLLVINKELETKERFLTLYIRYMDAKEAWKKTPSDQKLMAKRKDAARVLNTFVQEQLSQSSKESSTKRVPVMRAGMGRTPDESVIIFSDGTKWALPFEVAHYETSCWLCQ